MRLQLPQRGLVLGGEMRGLEDLVLDERRGFGGDLSFSTLRLMR
jgi:hypothetical protein